MRIHGLAALPSKKVHPNTLTSGALLEGRILCYGIPRQT